MKLGEITEKLQARELTGTDARREICGVYAGDIISRAMASGFRGMAWITAQANMNALAVAVMTGAACLIFPESIRPEEKVVERARTEKVALLVSGLSCFEAAGRLYAAMAGEENGGYNADA